MSLNLDPRQRAMLLEMGVHVWLPDALETEAAQSDAASQTAAVPSVQALPVARAPVQRDASAPEPGRAARPPASAGSSVVAGGATASRAETPGSAPAAWLLGAAQLLYADTAQVGGARWLVLAETSPMALPGGILANFSAFDGEAGKLLDNMLRAARVDRAGAALLAPLVRQGAATATPQFVAELAALVAQARPDIVLVMGRFASLSLFPIDLPFGKLRGHVHTLHGACAVVTYDASYLLRKPEDKAKAWADLCQAMSLGAAP
jgi:DNA polymerase